MKQKIETIATFSMVSSCLLYLLGSFAFASFNIKEWDDTGRILISVIGGIFILSIIKCELLEERKNGN